jgi:hypothetical protein
MTNYSLSAISQDLANTGAENTIGATSDPLKFSNYIPDTLPQTAVQATPVMNSGGFLSKATDTILDLVGLYGAKAIGSAYPTGQLSPQQLAAQQQANTAQPSAPNPYVKPLLIGGGVLAVVLIAAIVLRRK